MKPSLSSVLGAFRMLRRRSAEVAQPGLTVWVDAGERAAQDVQAAVRDGAHRAEVRARGLADDLREMMADGVIDADEARRLRMVPAKLNRVAEDCHDVAEVVS